MVWEIPEIVSSRPSPSFYNSNKTHLVRAANLFRAHKTRGCMPYVRRHTLKPMVLYAVSRTAYDAIGLNVDFWKLFKFIYVSWKEQVQGSVAIYLKMKL